MTRAFVIVGKAVALMTDLHGCFFEMEEMHRGDFCLDNVDLALAENWIERILREDVLDVCDEQLLMLLLVMNAEN